MHWAEAKRKCALYARYRFLFLTTRALPLAANQRLFGSDIYSNPDRLDSLAHALRNILSEVTRTIDQPPNGDRERCIH